MPGEFLSKEEVRTIARDEVKHDIEALRTELTKVRESSEISLKSLAEANTLALKTFAEANAATAKAVERLTMIVAGDEDLEIDGLAHDVKVLKAARQETMLEKAKLGGIWVGVAGAAVVVGKVLWYLIDKALS